MREASASEPPLKCRNRIRRCQNRGLTHLPGRVRGLPEGRPSGIRRVGGAKLNQALVRNVRTWPAMPREKAQAATTARLKVPMRRRGADCLGGGMKALAGRWSEGGGSSPLGLGQLVMPGGALLFSGRRQPSCDGTSRMMREYHVRFCEGLGVKFPGPTRQQYPFSDEPTRVRSLPGTADWAMRWALGGITD